MTQKDALASRGLGLFNVDQEQSALVTRVEAFLKQSGISQLEEARLETASVYCSAEGEKSGFSGIENHRAIALRWSYGGEQLRIIFFSHRDDIMFDKAPSTDGVLAEGSRFFYSQEEAVAMIGALIAKVDEANADACESGVQTMHRVPALS